MLSGAHDGLLPERLELVRAIDAPGHTEGLPDYVDFTFELTLNDPASSRLVLPVRITAQTARDETDPDDPAAKPDFAASAWASLMILADALHALASLRDHRVSDRLAMRVPFAGLTNRQRTSA